MKKIETQSDHSPCVCLRLRKASRAVSRFYDAQLQPANIRGTQYAMLRHIAAVSDITVGDLSELLSMDQSTATRGIDVLYKNGLIAFAASPDDARKKILVLTQAGTDKMREAEPLWNAAQKKIQSTLKGSDLASLFHLLDTVAEVAR